MATTQYTGSRYVPLFADPIEWSSAKSYEALTIVTHEGNSYTSKQFVPVGVDITNSDYWALTGNYNAQVELYRRDTAQALETAQNAQNDIDTLLPKSEFDNQNTVKNYIDASDEYVKEYINSLLSNNYENASYEIVFDGFDTDVLSYVTCIKLAKSDYKIGAFVSYREMQEAPNYKDIFKEYTNTIMCAPNLRADYFIRDGVATGQQSTEPWCLLCFTDENEISYVECYGTLPDASALIAQGVKQALFVWEPIVINGIQYGVSNVPIEMPSRDYILFTTHPRFVIGWDSDNIYLIAVSGSIPFSEGLIHEQLVTLIRKLNIRNAINCDGGGSTQLWICPTAYNLVYTRNVETEQQKYPNNSRAKPMTGFIAVR